MSFRKAKAEQASLKIGMYGPPGSGKTFTALLVAEYLASRTKKRVAFVDTERGTDFYSQAVKERKVHPEAFDFDAIYTRSITEVLNEVRNLDPKQYAVVVLDSMTHLWEAAIAAYSGRQTTAGTIPFHAWGRIKKPYKELMAHLLSTPIHVIICGRQGNEFEEDEETGETKKVGVKMKAEGETPYEPHILLRMEAVRDLKRGTLDIVAVAEKDRTGILQGNQFHNPTGETLVKPLLPLLGDKQAMVATVDETGLADAERLADEEHQREATSAESLRKLKAQFDLAGTPDEVEAVSKSITPELKKQLLPAHVNELRDEYRKASSRVKGAA